MRTALTATRCPAASPGCGSAQGAGGRFDAAVVVAFEAILANAAADYRTATSEDFRLEAVLSSL